MDHVMPPVYSKYFYNLHDQAKPTTYDKVEKIFLEEYGKKPDEIF